MTQAELDSLVDALIIDNTTGQINPYKVRQVFHAIISSIQQTNLAQVTATPPLNYDGFNNIFSILKASAIQDGYLSKEDFASMSLGYTPENSANKATTMSGNTTSNILFLSAKAVYDWGVGKFQDILTDVNFGNFINSLTEKTILVSADFFGIMDSQDSNKEKKISWKDLMLSLKMAFNGDTYSVQSTGAALSAFGIASPTTVPSGSNIAANYASTYTSNPIAFCVHRSASSGIVLGSSAEFYENTQKLVANGLGYFFHGKIAPTWVTGCANLLAITGSNAAIGNANPSSLIDFIGFGVDDSDSNLQFMHNDGSGTATKVDMGSNFAMQANNCYTFMIWNFYGSSDVYISILNLRNNAAFSATTNTDLPAITVGLAPHIWSGNRATINNIAAKFSYYTIQRQH